MSNRTGLRISTMSQVQDLLSFQTPMFFLQCIEPKACQSSKDAVKVALLACLNI